MTMTTMSNAAVCGLALKLCYDALGICNQLLLHNIDMGESRLPSIEEMTEDTTEVGIAVLIAMTNKVVLKIALEKLVVKGEGVTYFWEYGVWLNDGEYGKHVVIGTEFSLDKYSAILRELVEVIQDQAGKVIRT
jgi:hypothetical protein